MPSLAETFAVLKARHEAALICFLTAGDPSLDGTVELVRELESRGVDIVELGIPFTDPLADGPTIQAASERALKAGATLDRVLETVQRLRRECSVPLVFMTYYNPVLQYGLGQFAQACQEVGGNGVIITDLPPEEAECWTQQARGCGVDTVFLLAPTSTDERIQAVSKRGSGFIYCVSRLGVTGAQSEVSGDLKALVQGIRRVSDKPIAVGFGISTPAQVRTVCQEVGAEGAVVGSALVDLAARADKSNGDWLAHVGDFAAALKEATRQGGNEKETT